MKRYTYSFYSIRLSFQRPTYSFYFIRHSFYSIRPISNGIPIPLIPYDPLSNDIPIPYRPLFFPTSYLFLLFHTVPFQRHTYSFYSIQPLSNGIPVPIILYDPLFNGIPIPYGPYPTSYLFFLFHTALFPDIDVRSFVLLPILRFLCVTCFPCVY